MNHPEGGSHGGGHEPTELRVRGVVIFAIGLIVVIAVAQSGLGRWMSWYSRDEERTIAARPKRLADETGQFPSPQLQGNPGAEMSKFRNEEEAALASYGWVDRERGIAHLPIERAMELLVKRGLPTRTDAPRSDAKGAPR